VTDTPLDFSSDIDNLQIQLTNRLTTVSGRVSNDRNTVALDATVIVFADDEGKWAPHSRFIETARPDQHGHFKIRGLPRASMSQLPLTPWNLAMNETPSCWQAGDPWHRSHTVGGRDLHTGPQTFRVLVM